jgi:hypothetical protein
MKRYDHVGVAYELGPHQWNGQPATHRCGSRLAAVQTMHITAGSTATSVQAHERCFDVTRLPHRGSPV